MTTYARKRSFTLPNATVVKINAQSAYDLPPNHPDADLAPHLALLTLQEVTIGGLTLMPNSINWFELIDGDVVYMNVIGMYEDGTYVRLNGGQIHYLMLPKKDGSPRLYERDDVELAPMQKEFESKAARGRAIKGTPRVLAFSAAPTVYKWVTEPL